MKRLEFMNRLTDALADIPEEERADALKYYQDYLDDAEIMKDEEVPSSLGTPEKIAEDIRKLSPEAEPWQEEVEALQADVVKQDKGQGKEQNKWKLIAFILAGVLLSPVWFPTVICAFSLVIALFATIPAILAAFVAVGLVLLGGGIVSVGFGMGQIAALPATAAILIGVGLILAAFGFLMTAFFVWLLIKVMRVLYRYLAVMYRKVLNRIKGGRKQ